MANKIGSRVAYRNGVNFFGTSKTYYATVVKVSPKGRITLDDGKVFWPDGKEVKTATTPFPKAKLIVNPYA